jgi:DNA-binding transcriptional LysR family regulator
LHLFEAKLFKEIAQSKSISKAAAHNGISQSAATQHVQELERRLGLRLVDRSTRPLTLTEAGKLYADFCRDVLRREELFVLALERFKGEAEGSVRVASIYSIGLSEMSRLRQEFERRHPHAQLHVDYLRPDKIYEAVMGDQADLGLVSYPVAKRELDRFFRDQGVEVNQVMQFDNIQTIKEAVALGSGISILPERTMQTEIEQGRLISVPLHAPELLRPLGIVHRKRKKFNLAAQAFLNLLREQPVALAS